MIGTCKKGRKGGDEEGELNGGDLEVRSSGSVV